ncbi:MAG: SLBB domain-containing protein, partial [Gemmataceae bacterium]|nr:SLBB domain-containing protein [Gemmataceae bacterium]
MAAKPGKRGTIHKGLLGMMLAGLLPTGCTGMGGKPLLLFPQRETLPATARGVQPAPETQALPVARGGNSQGLSPLVKPGDQLRIQPVDPASPIQLPAEQTVHPNGTITLGRYGHMRVVGKTLAQIEQMAQTMVHARTRNAGRIQVQLLTPHQEMYHVQGEVNAPGAFALTGQQTVLDAIIAAGGLTDNAAPRSILVTRAGGPNECRIVLPVCYEEIVRGGDSTRNYPLAPGDRIFVARKQPPARRPARKPESTFRTPQRPRVPGTAAVLERHPYAMPVVSGPVKMPPWTLASGGRKPPEEVFSHSPQG